MWQSITKRELSSARLGTLQKQAAVAQDKAEKATQKVKNHETVDELPKKGGT